MASCGAKHTIALDTSGKLWYSGKKDNVGVEDSTEEPNQYVPKYLDVRGLLDNSFKYITSGEEHNFAIANNGRVYGFGKNQNYKLNSKL